MGSKPQKAEAVQPSTDLFEIDETSEEGNRLGVKTKKSYQYEFNTSSQSVEPQLLDHVWGDNVSSEDIRNIYIFDEKILGKGHFGSVRRAKFICDSKRIYAVKTLPMSKLKGDLYLLKRELEILRLMDHPNVIRFFDFYYVKEQYIHLVMEYCAEGNLFEKLIKAKNFDEETTKTLMFQILSVVNHLHNRGICHRDLRLENFLVHRRVDSTTIKLADFGLAKMFSSSELKTRVGSYHYVAPEIMSDKYSQTVDCWSVGVMMYMMLTGEPPFYAKNPNDLLDKVRDGGYSLKQPMWEKISPAAKELLSQLLEVDPAKRLSPHKAIMHNWFSSLHLRNKELGDLYLKKDLLERFHAFKKMSKFQKEVVKLMVMIFADTEEVSRLKYFFYYLDTQCHGVLTVMELKNFFNNFGEAVSENDIEDILKTLNFKFDKTITLMEFQAVTVEPFFVRDTNNIRGAYDRIRAQVPPYQILSEEELKAIQAEEAKKMRAFEESQRQKNQDFSKHDRELQEKVIEQFKSGLGVKPKHIGTKSQNFDVVTPAEEGAEGKADTPTARERSKYVENPNASAMRDDLSRLAPSRQEGPSNAGGLKQSEQMTRALEQVALAAVSNGIMSTNTNDRLPEMTGEILRDGLRKFGLRITAESFLQMLHDVKPNLELHSALTFEDFAEAMKRVYN